MARRADWRQRLAAAVAARRNTPFDWNGADCGLAAADLIQAVLGEDIAAPLRGYRSRFGALRALKRTGCDSVVDYLDRLFPRSNRARAGDLVVVPQGPLGPTLVADGRGGAWGPGVDGLERFPVPPGALFWSV